MKNTILVILAAATALVACTKSEAPVADQSRKAVRFSVQNLGSYQFKSATVALGEAGCRSVGIYAPELGANNVEATVAGNALTPASTIYWKIGQTTASQFVARYPYESTAPISGEYVIPANQSNFDDVFSYHSNVMYAVKSASPDPGTVAFDFKHPFAKVVVNVTNNLGADAVASVVMKQVKLAASTLNIATDPATITLSDAKSDVTACCTAEGKYEIVLMPQPATNEMDIVVTTTLGSTYTFLINLAEAYNFVAGKQSQVNVTLNPVDGGSSAGRTSVGAVTFNTPEQWTDGASTTVDSGDITVGNYFQVGGCVYSTADKGSKPAYWEKYYNMQYTDVNEWTITINYDESMAGEDASGKGLLIRRGDDYYGMWTGTPSIEDGSNNYELVRTDETHSNVKLGQTSGNYTIKITYVSEGDKCIINPVRNGAKE